MNNVESITKAMKKRILVVDDDEKIRKMLAFLLTAKGFAVESASNGKNALTALENSKPNLVILDLMMPHMDGFEVCEQMHARGYLDKTPVLVLSAYPYSEDVAKLISLGVSDFLSKPFVSSELLKKANNAISSQDC